LIFFLFNSYNHKTYKVDDIAWDKTPQITFSRRDGKEVSLIDYYQEVRMRKRKRGSFLKTRVYSSDINYK
jgi:hypothetical protein